MIKKIFFVYALALTLQLFTAGCVDCNCGPVKDIYFTAFGVAVKNIDAALPQPMTTDANVISSANYGIHIGMQMRQLVLRKQHINWGLIQTAQACSCDEGNFIAKEDILSLEIFSNNDFDATHPKNTDLSLYFKVKNNQKMLSIVDYLKSYKTLPYASKPSKLAFYDNVFLQVAPSSNKKHKFRVKITLSDGTILTAETNEVELS